jgi:molybdenum cofactor cytidylyltransferase
MKGNGRIVALILAAGFSSRMETFKPLLPVGGSPLIERTISRFLQAGFCDVRVIVGHRAEEVIPIVNRLGAHPVINENYPSGMYSSVRAGVRTLGKKDDAFFLMPGDCLLNRPETLAEMALVFSREKAGILYPTFGGRRGHPPLISALYKKAILSEEPPGGLKALLADHDDDAVEIEVDDPGILKDLDTPQEYRRALASCAAETVPGEERCFFLLNRHGVPDQVIAHSRKVTALARKITILLTKKGVQLDLNVITAAGLLHDLAKGKPHHAEVGMRIITAWGYPKVADIVGSHIDIIFADDHPPGEGEILYLVDKLVDGVRTVSLEERFLGSEKRYIGDADVAAAIRRRFACASQIKTMIESILEAPIEAVWTRDEGWNS